MGLLDQKLLFLVVVHRKDLSILPPLAVCLCTDQADELDTDLQHQDKSIQELGYPSHGAVGNCHFCFLKHSHNTHNCHLGAGIETVSVLYALAHHEGRKSCQLRETQHSAIPLVLSCLALHSPTADLVLQLKLSQHVWPFFQHLGNVVYWNRNPTSHIAAWTCCLSYPESLDSQDCSYVYA